MKRGQISTELLIIVGLVLLIFIPLLALVYFKAAETNEEIAAHQAELLVFRLAYLSNSIGSLGTNSTIYTDVYIPKNVISLSTSRVGNGGEITMKVQTPNGESEISEVVRYPIRNPSEFVRPGETSYGWARFKIVSYYEEGRCSIEITKE